MYDRSSDSDARVIFAVGKIYVTCDTPRRTNVQLISSVVDAIEFTVNGESYTVMEKTIDCIVEDPNQDYPIREGVYNRERISRKINRDFDNGYDTFGESFAEAGGYGE